MAKFRYVEGVLRRTFEDFGFAEIQTPIFEMFELFALRSGDEIRNTMFVFETGEGEMALRPELTAPVCRLIAEGKLSTARRPLKVYYIGRCFRYEEPQAGRYREFWQAGCELIGSAEPEADAEIIGLAVEALRRLGVSGYILRVGDVAVLRGFMEDKGVDYEVQNKVLSDLDHIQSGIAKLEAYKRAEPAGEALRDLERRIYSVELMKRRLRARAKLPGELVEKLRPDPRVYKLRELSKEELGEVIDNAIEGLKAVTIARWCYEGIRLPGRRVLLSPEIALRLFRALNLRGKDYGQVLEEARKLFADSKRALEELDRLEELVGILESYGVKGFILEAGLARGLEYYTGMVFEIHVPELGAQSQICGGGRYDKLVAEFGGPEIPAVGMAFGIDRLILALERSGAELPAAPKPKVYVVPAKDEVRTEAIKIAMMLRRAGIPTEVELMRRRLREAMFHANRCGFEYMVIVGPRELERGAVMVRDMTRREQREVKIDELVSALGGGRA